MKENEKRKKKSNKRSKSTKKKRAKRVAQEQSKTKKLRSRGGIEDYAKESEMALEKIVRFVDTFEPRAAPHAYGTYDHFWNILADTQMRVYDNIKGALDEALASGTFEDVVKRVAASGIDIDLAIKSVKYSSDQEGIEWGGTQLITALLGRSMTQQEASDLNDYVDSKYSNDARADEDGDTY